MANEIERFKALFGEDNIDVSPQGDVAVYDPQANDWRVITKQEVPTAVESFGAGLVSSLGGIGQLYKRVTGGAEEAQKFTQQTEADLQLMDQADGDGTNWARLAGEVAPAVGLGVATGAMLPKATSLLTGVGTGAIEGVVSALPQFVGEDETLAGQTALGAGLGGAAGAVGRGIQRAAKPAGKLAQAAIDYMKDMADIGAKPPVSAVTGGTFAQMGARTAESMIGSMKPAREAFEENVARPFAREASDVLEAAGGKMEAGAAAPVVSAMRGETVKGVQAVGEKMFREAEKLAAANEIVPNRLLTMMKKVQGASEKQPSNVDFKDILDRMSRGGKYEGDTATDFQILKNIRSTLSDALGYTREPISTAEKANIKRMITALDMDIREAVPEAAEAYQKARQVWAKQMTTFRGKDGKAVENILNAAPEQITSVIRPGNSKQVRILRNAVGDDGFQFIKREWLSNLLEKNSDNLVLGGGETIRIPTKGLKKDLDRLGPILDEVLTPDEKGRIMRLAGVVERTWNAGRVMKNTSGTAQLASAIQVATSLAGGVVGGGITPGGVASAVGIFGLPYVLTKAVLTDTGKKWLTTGVLPKTARAVAETGKQAVAPALTAASNR